MAAMGGADYRLSGTPFGTNGTMEEASNRARALRDELSSVFSKAKVPTNPTVAVEILRLADDPGSTAEQFAEVIQTDPALAARLLELANAAAYAQREPVTTIKRAVTVMGLRRIRAVALGFQLVAHLDRLGDAAFDLKSFWQHSVLRACLAREIATRVVPDHAEEAFVVGLLQDCGVLLLVQVLGESYSRLYASQNLSPTAFHDAELERCPWDHVEAIRALASEWRMPALIAEPLGSHHQPVTIDPEATVTERLCGVSYLVGSLPLVSDLRPAASEPALQGYAQAQLGLDESELHECLEQAGEAYHHVAPLLADHLPGDLDVAALLDEANRHLSQWASEAEKRAEEVEAERDHIRRQQDQLRSALGQYRERAARDPLTRLLNRGALMEATLGCIRECRDRNLALAVFFLDIDDFKVINDEYGHHIGDEVLRGLAGTLNKTVVNGGFAGRYGGEEFVVVAPAVDEAEARRQAQQIVQLVRNSRLTGDGPAHRVTCSVGAVWGRPRTGTTPEDLFTAADELMYRAKVRGKDRCCFRSLTTAEDVVELMPSAEAGEPDLEQTDSREGAGVRGAAVADELRRVALDLNRTEPTRFASMRKHERQGLVTPCVVNFFVSGAPAVHSSPGYVRNISTGGLGVLATRPMIRGEPVEVAVVAKRRPDATTYLAGLVAFCRHVTNGIYEVGIQLVARSHVSILSGDASSLDDEMDWVTAALQATHGADIRYRESA
jgi:diguanylate cyclase (GGDEF)-like protein